MTNKTSRLFAFAAGVVLCATSAWGQSPLRATIPFAFETAGSVMPAGDYSVVVQSQQGSSSLVLLRNVHTKRAVLAMGRVELVSSSDKKPSLDFVCASSACTLRNIWTGSSNVVYDRGAKPSASQRVASVPMAVAHGD